MAPASPSSQQQQQRLVRLNDTLTRWLRAAEAGAKGSVDAAMATLAHSHGTPTAGHRHRAPTASHARKMPKAPKGYHALPATRDGLGDDPRLARTAFVRAFVTHALLSAQARAATTPRTLLRGLARARGLLLYRVARARHAAGKPLPLNPLWRERPATSGQPGRPRHVPAWALAAPAPMPAPAHPPKHRPAPHHQPPHTRAAGDTSAPPPAYDPNSELIANPDALIDLGDGVTMTGAEVQALWDAFVADPQGVLGAADTGDWVSLADATQFFTEFAQNPLGVIARYGDAESLMRYVTSELARDGQALWDHLLTSVGPSLALGGAEGDALAFWATNGEVFDLTPDEIAAAQDEGSPSATGGAANSTASQADEIALADQDVAYPYPDSLLAEGRLLSDLTVTQLLNSYWAQQDAQTAGQMALGDAGVPAGLISSFDLVNPATTDFLRQQAGALVVGIDERTRALLGDALWNAYAGINFAALPRDYRMASYLQNYMKLFQNDLQGMSASRALLIARTEGARAANFGQMVALARLGVRYVRWVVNAGACQICVGNGEVDYVKYGESFPGGFVAPPQHPLCLVAGTPILTEQGEVPIEQVTLGTRVWTHEGRWRPVVSTVKAQYVGPIIRLTMCLGRRVRAVDSEDVGPWVTTTLELTPDHPLWSLDDTSTSWVAARDIGARTHRFAYVRPDGRFEAVVLDAPPTSRECACMVYNLEVEEDHSYVAAGIVSHNCRCAISPYVPDEFNPNDWTELPLSPDDVAGMLFNPDYGAFPASGWPITADDATPTAATSASASDLGLLDTSQMSPALQSVLTPDAIASLQTSLGETADNVATQWLDEQGLPLPQSESGFTYYFDPEGADAEPQMNPDTLTRIRTQFGQAVDDWYASLGGDAADESDIEGE